jgi:ornithine cyclodeaminase/alanine dehydrogenase-like protein (mu-crystallin family)
MALFLTTEDLIRAGGLDMGRVASVVTEALVAHARGEAILPVKTSVVLDPTTQARCNAMPAALPKAGVIGVKWVSVFPENPARHRVPTVAAVMVVSNASNGSPLAILDATLVSNMRTGAMTAVAARHLARRASETAALVGAGAQGQTQLLGLATGCPGLKRVRVAAKTPDEAERFVRAMALWAPGVGLEAAPSVEAAARQADVIVTATSAQQPFLRAEWIAPGSLYVHVAQLEDEFGVARQADRIVVDHWETLKKGRQTLSVMYREGLLKDSDIYAELCEIVAGIKPGRERESERIYFSTVGMAHVDLAVAATLMEEARRLGLGTPLPFTPCDLTDAKVARVWREAHAEAPR